MARGRLWGYVASGARALGALGGTVGAFGGASGAGGPGRLGGGSGRTGGGSGRTGAPATTEAEEARGPLPPGAMAAPRSLSRTELERLRWTGRRAGCEPMARHVQVADVVRRVVRGGGRAAAVTVRVAPGLPVVAGDARRLEAAVAGLVDQAIRRSPPGGPVLLRADVAGGAPPLRSPGRTAVTGGRVEIRVCDRGSYEQPGERERRIAGARADGPVGPALYSLVEAAGGRLAVEPTPGGGLTVVLLLAVAYD